MSGHREGGRERAAYRDVGAAMRQAVDRAVAAPLTRAEWRIFGAVLRCVASYSLLEERVYVDDIAEKAHVSERHTRTCLDRLAREYRIINWWPRRGHGTKSLVGLPREGETGRLGRPLSEAIGRAKPEETGGLNRKESANKPEPQDFRRPRTEKKQREESSPVADGDEGEDVLVGEVVDEEDDPVAEPVDRAIWRDAFNALAEATGSHPSIDAERLAKATKMILAACRTLGIAEEDAPAEIRGRARLYRERFDAALTPLALARNWTLVTQPRTSRGRGLSVAEVGAVIDEVRGRRSDHRDEDVTP